MITIFSIPAFQDNYIWALVCDTTKQCVVVDPGDANPVLDFIQKNKLKLIAILLTHKHADHTGGVEKLLRSYPKTPVFSSQHDRISSTTNCVQENDVIQLKNWPTTFHVIDIPAHTTGHIAYYTKPFLFCGDTLFTGGCGRVFEGTPEQMLASLKKLTSLPDETAVYCGHEYTEKNLAFAVQVDQKNIDLEKRYRETKKLREKNEITVPSTMALEKATNPFLRCNQKNIIATLEMRTQKKLQTEAAVFAAMREWKNNF